MPEKTETPLAVTFVAIGPNVWGKGLTVSEAVKNCKKEMWQKGKIKIRVPARRRVQLRERRRWLRQLQLGGLVRSGG